LPVRAALGTLPGTIIFRAVASTIATLAVALPTRTAEFGTILVAPIVARAGEAWTFIATAIVTRPLIPLAPRLVVPTVAPAKLAIVAALLEFPVLETSGRTRLVPVATRRTVVAVKSPGGPVTPVTARRGVIVPASRRAFAAKVALVTFALAGKIALVAFAGELPFPAPCGKGAVLAAATPITPAAGSVVFIVVAGHEKLVSNEARVIRCTCGAH
ncbi:MAG TPA: hypothetical protein VIH63_06390, partial [Xanthobacteraceae bacterium]